jgi:hypothetical protein
MSSALEHSLELERRPPSLRPFTDQGIQDYNQIADVNLLIVTPRPQSVDSCSERDSHFADVAPVTSEGYESLHSRKGAAGIYALHVFLIPRKPVKSRVSRDESCSCPIHSTLYLLHLIVIRSVYTISTDYSSINIIFWPAVSAINNTSEQQTSISHHDGVPKT